MFDTPDKLILGLLTGILFGFLLQKGRVAKYSVILGQLLLKDWTVFKIMATAIVVGAIGVYTMVAMGTASLHVRPFLLGGVLLGAVLFGIGMAAFGYCPGTSVAASGEGSRDAMAGVIGMLTGAGIFVAIYPWMEPVIQAGGNLGEVTIPQLLAMPPWVVIVLIATAVLVVFGVIERFERQGATSGSVTRARAGWWAWLGRHAPERK